MGRDTLWSMVRQRMTGRERREQLISIGRATFAERGFDGTSVEEIASRAGVSKPVVYEHFGGKEGLYAVIIDREMLALEAALMEAIQEGRWLERIEKVVMAALTYVEEETDGFIILVRDQAPGEERGYATLMNSVVDRVAHFLGRAFEHRGLDPEPAILYAQALTGMVSNTAQWWLDKREPAKEVVAAHLVNMCWNGLSGMQAKPKLTPHAPEAGVASAGGGEEGEENEGGGVVDGVVQEFS